MRAPAAILFWPGAPVLVEGVNRRPDERVRRLRDAIAATLQADDAAPIVLVGEGHTTRVHTRASWGSLAGFGADLAIGLSGGKLVAAARPNPGDRILPASLTAGLLLLQGEGPGRRRVIAVEIDPEADPDGGAAVAEAVGLCGDRPVVIAVGEGSARSTRSSPGPYAPEAAEADQRILAAIEEGDPEGLIAAADAAGDLQISGAAAWKAVCSILKETTVRPVLPAWHDRPFGVEYFVAAWSVAGQADPHHKGVI